MTPICNLSEGFESGAAFGIEASPEGIVRGLEQLLRLHPAELDTMGTNGRALVASRFTWRKVAAGW